MKKINMSSTGPKVLYCDSPRSYVGLYQVYQVPDCTRGAGAGGLDQGNRGAELQYRTGGSTLMSDEQYCTH